MMFVRFKLWDHVIKVSKQISFNFYRQEPILLTFNRMCFAVASSDWLMMASSFLTLASTVFVIFINRK